MKSGIDYAGALRRGWWLVVLLVIIALATTTWFTSRQRPVYEASAMLVVAPSAETTDTGDIVRGLETLERRTVVATFARIPTTRESRAEIAEGIGVEEKALRGVRIHGSVVPNTNIIRISAEGPGSEIVAAAANGAAELTARKASSLYRIYSLHPLEAATEPRRADYPDPQRNLLVGGLLGLVLGIAAALALDRLRQTRSIAGD